MNVRKNRKVGIRRPGWRSHFHYWGYCVYKSCHFSIMTCEMQSGRGWRRKRINCKALCSYQGTPSAPAAQSSAELSREGVDDSASGWLSVWSRSETHQHWDLCSSLSGQWHHCREHFWSSEGNKSLNRPPTSVPLPLNLDNINSLCRKVYWFLRTVADFKNSSVLRPVLDQFHSLSHVIHTKSL